jgi:hypothetical protein
MRSSIVFDAGRAEYMTAWQWMLGQIPETTEAGRLTQVLRCASASTIKVIHLSEMKFAGNVSLVVCCRKFTGGLLEFGLVTLEVSFELVVPFMTESLG